MTRVVVRSVSALLVLAAAASAQVVSTSKYYWCPPNGNPKVTEYGFDKAGKKVSEETKELSFDDGEDVNGDGKKDFGSVLCRDLKGNKVEQWCAQKSNVTPQQFYYCYVPAEGPNKGKRLWFGGCYFANGRNAVCCEGDEEENGPDKGKIKEFSYIAQKNVDRGTPEGQDPTGTADKLFEHNLIGPSAGKNTITITKGKWFKQDGIWNYETEENDIKPSADPPAAPQNLLAVLPTDDHGGTAHAYAALVPDTSALPVWTYRLFSGPLLEDDFSGGGADDVYVERPVEMRVRAGDSLTITGVGITSAFVGGDAAAAEFGA